MLQINKSIPDSASDYVFGILKDKLQGIYVYHNYKHTEDVVDSVKKLAAKQNLSAEDTEIVTLAAWFHDTGFIERSINHEDISIRIAEDYLKSINYSDENIAKVIGCINATRYPQLPQNILEEIIADADLFHLGTKDYYDKTELLRLEWERSENKKFTDLEWLKLNIDFLTGHKYFTKYSIKNLDGSKTEKLIKLQILYRKKLKKAESSTIKKEKFEIKKEELAVKKNSLMSVDDVNEPERINSLFIIFSNLISQRNSFDKKADVMLLINSFLILLPISSLMFVQNINHNFYIPVFIILTTALLCIIFSVFESNSNTIEKNLNKPDLPHKTINPFLLKNFSKMSYKEFSSNIDIMFNNKNELSERFTEEYYFLSKEVLKKQEYVRKSYLIFTYGMILSVLAFAIACFQTI
jgi:predicted metal-dependent HD superfamily phosphohydrolase